MIDAGSTISKRDAAWDSWSLTIDGGYGPKPTHWHWVRREDGGIAPYRFQQARVDTKARQLGEFFVGGFIRTFPLSAVVGEAEMPSRK